MSARFERVSGDVYVLRVPFGCVWTSVILVGDKKGDCVLIDSANCGERVDDTLIPALSELVIPYFKLKGRYPGFDILTFDDMARPLCLEVKTSLPGTTGFCLTPNEKKAADSLIAAGCRYVVRCITDWGSEEQAVTDYPYGELEQTHDIKAAYYRVAPKPKGREQLSGIAYYRMLRELRQEDLSRLTGIPQCDLSLYETGARRATVHTCKRLAEALDTTVQSLLATYDAPPRG